MTGKEALKEWIAHYRIDCHKYCGDSFLEKLKIIEKDLDKLDKVEEKLTKYERAFEILKREGLQENAEFWAEKCIISIEEYKLLEELMKDA